MTTPRADVDAIVTEWGVAELRGCSLVGTRPRMIAIAAPEHRDALYRRGWPASGGRCSAAIRSIAMARSLARWIFTPLALSVTGKASTTVDPGRDLVAGEPLAQARDQHLLLWRLAGRGSWTKSDAARLALQIDGDDLGIGNASAGLELVLDLAGRDQEAAEPHGVARAGLVDERAVAAQAADVAGAEETIRR